MIRHPPRPPLFPYTTLFRSRGGVMRHRAKHRQLSRTASHRKALLANMATSLFKHDRVVTTEAKAKELRPYAERLITLARRGDRKSTRLNSSHPSISYAVFCL